MISSHNQDLVVPSHDEDDAGGSLAALTELGLRSVEASRVLALARSDLKDAALCMGADCIDVDADDLMAANQSDLRRAEESGATKTQLDRLRLSPERISTMSQGLRQVAALADPVGQVVSGSIRPNGLSVQRVRVPLGVVGIIYENRPNVTSDAAGLCLKAGNATMLRGSSSALESNKLVVASLQRAMLKAGLPQDSVLLVEDVSHRAAQEFMQLEGIIDCLIPRGGPALLESVRRNATVPTVIDGDGNCHVYVHRDADLEMALRIIVNAKTQRPGVCNAAETLVVDADVASAFLPLAAEALGGVELRGDQRARAIVPMMSEATPEDFATEFLDMVLAVAVVDGLTDAIGHITRYSSGHSEAIVTKSLDAADRFCKEVDASAVLVNASTRFIDGFELGLGAEIGISTQKLHARGPMGLESLTCPKYVVRGSGQVRT